MKAMMYTGTGGLDVLNIQDIKKPVPGDNQVLIQVKAGALNVADYQRFESGNDKVSVKNRMMNFFMGFNHAPIGAEIAGVVVETGKNISHVKVGDSVFGKVAGTFPKGGFAEYALMDKERVGVMPDNYTYEQAASVSISFETALGAIRKGNVKAGMDVMVYGASGGVGLFTAQLAKAVGANVTGVCSTRNVDILKEIGIDTIIDYKTSDFTRCDKKFDVIIGVNGYNPMKKYKQLLKDNGIFVGVGGAKQGFHAMGCSFFDKHFTYLAGMATIQDGYLKYAKELAESGKITPVIDKEFSIYDVKDAINYLLKSHAQGKVVVKMDF